MGKSVEIFNLIFIPLGVGVGLFLIIGALKRIRFIVDPPRFLDHMYPYKYLKALGKDAVRKYHLLIGLALILGIIIYTYAMYFS